MIPPVTLTIDLEDPSERYASNEHVVGLAQRILSLCDTYNAKATFFTVGRILESYPALVKEIANRGHEVAYHSHAHCALNLETRKRFTAELAQDKDKFEQLTGQSLLGFRAPCYSLTPETAWALDVLKEQGFLYSSSIMPTRLSRYGFAKVPRKAFRWPNGLIEFPLPVKNICGIGIPYLGGIYLYALPIWLSGLWRKQARKDEILWTYVHPYDLDRKEPFTLMPNTAKWVSLVLWLARRVAEKKLRHVVSLGTAETLAARAKCWPSSSRSF